MNKKICRITEKVGKLLVAQMSNELYNYHLYLSMANFFALEGIIKLEEYYRLRAKEEHVHFMWIFDYLNECDYSFKVPSVIEVKEAVDDTVQIFKDTVEAEIKTSDDIDAIYKMAVECSDNHTRCWLDSKLIPEQHEEETTSRTALDLISLEDVNIIERAELILELLEKK